MAVDIMDKLRAVTGNYAGLAQEARDEIRKLREFLVAAFIVTGDRLKSPTEGDLATGGWTGSYVGSAYDEDERDA